MTSFSSLSAIFSTAIAVSFAAIASAVPMESRYPVAPTNSDSLVCYMNLDNGSTIDLTGLCVSSRSMTSSSLSGSSGDKATGVCPEGLKSSGNKDSGGGIVASLTYVHGYTRSDGTPVGGYSCRK